MWRTPALLAQALEPRELRRCVDEIVDLVEVDVPVERERVCGLALALGRVRRPELRRHVGRAAAGAEPVREDALGLAVHRRGVIDADAGVEAGDDDRLRARLRGGAAHVERLPGAHADDGQRLAGEWPRLHGPG